MSNDGYVESGFYSDNDKQGDEMHDTPIISDEADGVILHVHLKKNNHNALVRSSDRTGLTRTDVVNQALIVYDAVTEALNASATYDEPVTLKVENQFLLSVRPIPL
jgi:hypothetical protein